MLRLRSILLAACVLASVGFLAPPASAATVLYVDNTVSCSDVGPATQVTPLCTIGAGAIRATPGDTVEVLNGTYSTTVTPPTSGTAGLPITFDAASPSVTISGSTDGFAITGKSWVTVNGFTISGTTGAGIVAQSSASHIVISGNTVTGSGHPVSGQVANGIALKTTTDSIVSGNTLANNTDAGIYLNATATGNTVTQNLSYGNARVYTRAAPGIDDRGPGNTITRNIVHDNEDSGIQVYNVGASDNTVVADNLAYDNGDHGIDNLGSAGTTIVANTSVSNTTAGINVEGGSTGATLANNISVDNALTNTFGQKGQIRVDASSVSGTTIDRDLVHMTAAGGYAFNWNSTKYPTLSAFQVATGQEPNGLQADPLFVSTGGHDFHIGTGSPAIDSADASAPQQPALDLDGNPRFDDPATVDTGAGSPTYEDRGAYEYQGSGLGPLDHITISPETASIAAGATQDYTAEGFDENDNSLGDVTADTTFDASSGASCAGASCGSSTIGSYTITGTDGDKTAGASLDVVAGPLDHLVVVPADPTIAAGATQTFTASGADQYGNATGDLTDSSTFSIDGSETCTVNSCGATTAGGYTVTADHGGGVTGETSLTVVPGPLDHIQVSPATASIASGTTQSYTVEGFDSFGNPIGDVTPDSSFAVAPAGASCLANACGGSTPGSYTVSATDGTASADGALTVLGAPVISSFTPPNGIVGTTVTINGSNFTGATGVSFGATAPDFSVVSDTQITAVVPPEAVTGKIQVSVGSAVATSPKRFGVKPTISSFTPGSGIVGSQVTITGTGYAAVTSVKFGTVAAPFTIDSPTQITAVVPAGATKAKINVVTAGGGATTSTAFNVVPVISSFSPPSGAVGSVVTIDGSGFVPSAAVKFRGVKATTVTFVSSSELQAVVPAGATTGKIAVKTAGGSAMSPTPFTVTP